MVVAKSLSDLVPSKKMQDIDLEVWLKNIICGLVEQPDKVTVTKTLDEQGVLFTVKVADGEAGKVIGREGMIATAIRTILRSAGYMQDMRASMKVDAPGSDYVPADRDR